ncbi:MAG: 3-dehydroquinate dehydratase [Bacteroidia bacterium]|nr:3-dehydroquinate dehydratase [Bacteroidia bacterium]MDW8235765.1 type II 3-dehydroquinate dehydratase [Bacteroidia bacterium]
MKRIRILHGPNVRLIGRGREPELYRSRPWDEVWKTLQEKYSTQALLSFFESPHEGQLISWIWEVEAYDGLIFNPGALAHTSYALYDALRGAGKPCIEVHVSQIYARERFRHRLITAAACRGVIIGLGEYGYEMALLALLYGDSNATDIGSPSSSVLKNPK